MILNERLRFMQPSQIQVLFDELFLQDQVAKFVEIHAFHKVIFLYKVYNWSKRQATHSSSPPWEILSNFFKTEHLLLT